MRVTNQKCPDPHTVFGSLQYVLLINGNCFKAKLIHVLERSVYEFASFFFRFFLWNREDNVPGFRLQVIVESSVDWPAKQDPISLVSEVERYHLIQTGDAGGEGDVLRGNWGVDPWGEGLVEVTSHSLSQSAGADGTFVVGAFFGIKLELPGC